jgi:hypothetical protein
MGEGSLDYQVKVFISTLINTLNIVKVLLKSLFYLGILQNNLFSEKKFIQNFLEIIYIEHQNIIQKIFYTSLMPKS